MVAVAATRLGGPDAPAVPGADALVGLRALAVAAVVGAGFAAPGLPGGWIGIEVVFVLVGFEIGRSVWGIGVVGAVRRSSGWVVELLLAIAPALVFMVGWAYVQDGEFSGSVRLAGLAGLTQTYNLAQAFAEPDGRAFAPLWAVALGAQLALVGVVAAVAGSTRFDRRRAAGLAFGAASMLVVARLVALALEFEAGGLERLPWFRLDGMVLGVGAGVLHARVVVAERQWLYRAAPWALGALGVAVISSPEPAAWSAPNLGVVVPLVAVATATVAVALGSRSAAPGFGRALASRWLVWIGHRAVELYAWHWVIGVMLVGGGSSSWQGPTTFVAQVGFTMVAAFAAHEFVADPIRRRLPRFSGRLNRP